jgi:hypothetical protein
MTTYRFRIVDDQDFDPSTSVDWSEEETAEYVARFDTSGDLGAFGLEVERSVPECVHCGRGQSWEPGASLWGIDVVVNGPARDALLDEGEGWQVVGEVDLPAPVSDDAPGGSYLALVLAELLAESAV